MCGHSVNKRAAHHARRFFRSPLTEFQLPVTTFCCYCSQNNRRVIMALYAQTSGTLSTNSGSYVPIPGLEITLPIGVDTLAMVVLNVPNPYATGNDFPGGTFSVSINGQVSPVQATFTYNEQIPVSTGRIPTTLVVGIPLGIKPQAVVGVWYGVRGSTVHIDSPASLSSTI
jgi:mannose-binding lectin